MATTATRRVRVPRSDNGKPKQIKRLSTRPKYPRILIYSEPGGGKSRLVGSSALIGPTLILNADGPDGPESMRAAGYDPDVWDVNSYRELDAAYDWCRHHPREYQFVWLDGITLYQVNNIQQILADQIEKTRKTYRDPDVPDKAEYLREQTKTFKWIRHMTALPFVFGITAHVMTLEDDEGEVMYLPQIQGRQGQLSSKVCGAMSIVGRLEMQRKKGDDGVVKRSRRLVVQYDGKHYAKDRFDALGTYVAQPTMPKVMELLGTTKRRVKQ